MEYKILGSARQPAEDFKNDLATFFRLDDEQRNTLERWFLSAESFDLYAPELPAIIAESTLLPEQFRQAAGAIRSLLSGWCSRELDLLDIERDLLLLGCDAAQVSMLSQMLTRLSPIKEHVWIEVRKDAERVTGLPTIDDFSIVWNVRPVFAADAVYFYESDRFESSYDRLLDTVYLATIEMSASDSNGNKQTIALQVDERTFENLARAMNRATKQLNALKASVRAIEHQPDHLGRK